MKFKLWLEVVELRKPSGKVVRQNVIKDKGTNVARKVIQYTWTTQNGNIIKLMFEPDMWNSDDYFVMFYVNDVLFDFASKKEGKNRDIDILSNVFYLLKLKANQLKANTIKFRAHKGEKDERYVKNLDIEKPKSILLPLINDQKNQYKTSEWLEPSENLKALYQKISKPIPEKYRNPMLISLEQIEAKVNQNEEIMDYPDFENPQLMMALKQYNYAVRSHSSIGVQIDSNRRKKIYERIVRRDFQDWDISIKDDMFILKRNQ